MKTKNRKGFECEYGGRNPCLLPLGALNPTIRGWPAGSRVTACPFFAAILLTESSLARCLRKHNKLSD